MSATASSLINCPNLQVELNEYWRNCSTVRESLPFFEFMMSPENRDAIQDQITIGSGKLRTVEVRYDQRYLESTVTANQPNPTCSASTKEADKSATYTIDPNVNFQIERAFDVMDLVRICRTNETYVTGLIQRMIDALMRRVATATAVEAVALTGGWSSDTPNVVDSELNVTTLRSGTTDQLAPFTMEDIDLALRNSGYCDSVAIFSGSTLEKYARRVMAGCCADSGVDLRELFDMYGKAVVWDRRVKDAYGSDDKALVVQRGALQLLVFNLFEGMEGVNVMDDGDYKQMVIRDPLTGFPIDMVWKYDCGKVNIILTATTKVIALPNDLYQVGDVYRGVTWASTIKVANS